MDPKLALRVISVEAELERADRDHGGELAANAGYYRLCIDANSRGLTFRRMLAEACYLAGGRAIRGSRAFDNCFENNDGDQVVAYLVDRARENPTLHAAIARDFGGAFPARWIETAARLEPQPCLI